MQKIIMLAIAGACGTLSRYGLCELTSKTKFHIPLGTLSVNILGSFLFGLIWVLATRKTSMPQETRLILLTGFMGAFTTFSTFAFETARLLHGYHWWKALANISAHTFLGIAALVLGVLIARLF